MSEKNQEPGPQASITSGHRANLWGVIRRRVWNRDAALVVAGGAPILALVAASIVAFGGFRRFDYGYWFLATVGVILFLISSVGKLFLTDVAEDRARDRVAQKFDKEAWIYNIATGKLTQSLHADSPSFSLPIDDVRPWSPDAKGPDLERLRLTAEARYFDKLVEINVENLAAYYELVKRQTDKSFWATLAIATIGCSLLFAGLIAGYSTQGKETMAYLTAGSGLVTEFIAAVFFYLYNRTVRQLKDYHDSLLDVQNVLLSFKIVADTAGDSKTRMVEQLLGHLISKKPPAALAPDTVSPAVTVATGGNSRTVKRKPSPKSVAPAPLPGHTGAAT